MPTFTRKAVFESVRAKYPNQKARAALSQKLGKNWSHAGTEELARAIGLQSARSPGGQTKNAARATTQQHGVAKTFAANAVASKLTAATPERQVAVRQRIVRAVDRELKAQEKASGRKLTTDEKRKVAIKALHGEVQAIKAGKAEAKPAGRKKEMAGKVKAKPQTVEKAVVSEARQAKISTIQPADKRRVNAEITQMKRDLLALKLHPHEAEQRAYALGGRKAVAKLGLDNQRVRPETALRLQGREKAAAALAAQRKAAAKQDQEAVAKSSQDAPIKSQESKAETGSRLEELGAAAKLSQGAPIKSQEEFDKIADHAFPILDQHQKTDGLVSILALRNAMGERVSKEAFDKHLSAFQNKGYTLVGGEAAGNKHYSREQQIAGGITTAIGGVRFYIRKDK